jgi:putative phosphoribosyl transferase
VRFRDRQEAGRVLAERLAELAGRQDVVVLGLPRGGVPVAYEVARALGVALDMFLVRKLGVPGHEELAMGAIASGGVRALNDRVLEHVAGAREALDEVTARETSALECRERAYRGDRPAPGLRGRIVVLVDDGLATGASMRAAIAAVRQHEPARIVVAVPVAPPATCAALEQEADEVVCAHAPESFFALSAWYRRFDPPSDDEIRRMLDSVPAGPSTAG